MSFKSLWGIVPPNARTEPTFCGRLGYTVCTRAAEGVGRLVYGWKVQGREHLPLHGPVLVIANHQSYLDPPMIGSAFNARPLEYLARAGLFRAPVLGRMMRFLHATPIGEGEGEIAGMRQMLAMLAEGKAVLVFPEGARTRDGSIGPFKRGITLLIRKASCPVMPVALDGFFEAWPRTRRWPRIWGQRLRIKAGPVMDVTGLARTDPDAMLELLRTTIEGMRQELRSAAGLSREFSAGSGRGPASGSRARRPRQRR